MEELAGQLSLQEQRNLLRTVESLARHYAAAVLSVPAAPSTQFELVEGIPYFPRPDRAEGLQELANLGLAAHMLPESGHAAPVPGTNNPLIFLRAPRERATENPKKELVFFFKGSGSW